MMSAFNFGNYNRGQSGKTEEIQKLIEKPTTTITELLKHPSVVYELQNNVDSRSYFTTEKLQSLIEVVFNPDTLASLSFEEGRRVTFSGSELLSNNVSSIIEFFFHTISDGGSSRLRRSVLVSDEGETEQDNLMLSPVNSVRSKSTTTVDSYNKAALDFLFDTALNRKEIDETRAGYLNKVVLSFLQKHKNEFLNYIFKSGFEYKRLILYAESFSIADLIVNITLFEEMISGNDSVVFHESHAQASNDHTLKRSDLLLAFFANPLIVESREISSNIRFVLDEFLGKFKNINEAEELFIDVFGYEKSVLEFWLASLKATHSESVNADIIGCLRSFAKFLVAPSEYLKSLFVESSIFYKQMVVCMSELVRVIVCGADRPIAFSRPWVTTHKGVSSVGLKSRVAFLETCLYLLRQKVVLLPQIFSAKSFIQYVLVCLLE
jgi:hypothetical protein